MADFVHFRFGDYYSKDLNLIVTSSSNFYSQDLLPSNTDTTTDISGGNGKYYFGSIFSTREFTLNLAFDSITEDNLRLISQIFGDDRPQDLVFDERPYKTYKAKIKSKPTFKYVCFEKDGERVYKGTGTLNMICYSPFAFCFNKYIVRSADYYLNTPPEKAIKEWYNTEINDQPWYGGYPTYEQVQKGELYFDTPSGAKSIINVRRYWDNVPEWARSSRLLTTPTLDYDQELMYAPQCSKVGYLNLDKGFERNIDTNILSNRLFVYNPGDLPIDFTLNFNNPQRFFATYGINRFRIRRLNVQRLSTKDAIDWCGLTTQNANDNALYKYDKKYFKRVGQIDYSDLKFVDDDGNTLSEEDIKENIKNFLKGKTTFSELKECHPNHCYMIEPIPRERLGNYIRTFYWQTEFNDKTNGIDARITIEEGEKLADRYEELYQLCITEQEKFQLYWETLRQFLYIYQKQQNVFDLDGSSSNKIVSEEAVSDEESDDYSLDINYTIDTFVNDYLFNPPEYLVESTSLAYGEFNFNLDELPQYFTEDYLEFHIDETIQQDLILDTENRMLYNIDSSDRTAYNYKTTKNILNDYIDKGHWFQLPPGWSVIEIIPVVENENDINKTWKTARNFNWGYSTKDNSYDAIVLRSYYDCIEELALPEFHSYVKYNLGLEKAPDNQYLRRWFIKWNDGSSFGTKLYNKKINELELQWLKLLQSYWSFLKSAPTGKNNNQLTGSIDEWFWYACNYIWELFPPTFWSYVNLFDKATIKYIPLYY